MADTICAFLEARGMSCWIAPRNILPGEEWGDSILRGIQQCRIMVLIFSKAANDSGPVRSEVDRAVNARKVLIPFRIENVAPTGAMEFHIGRRHWLDAYAGPMEGHLGLLARAVGDVLHPEEAGAVEEPGALPESTLGRETIAPPTEVPAVVTAPAGPDDLPLRIFLNFDHVVVAGYPSTFQMLAENKGKTPLDQIEIVMESRGLERPASRTLTRLAPGQSQRHLFEIDAVRSGNFVLQCTVKCLEEDRQLAFVGSRALRINEAPGTANIVINMKDLHGNSGGANAESEARIGGLGPGTIRSLNDLLNLELATRFEPLELALDYNVNAGALVAEEASAAQRLQIPVTFLAQAQAGRLLRLEPADTSANRPPEIRLSARDSFALGRSREEADLVTWFWPRNETNDSKTRRISKKHAVFERQGAKIFLRDSGGAGQTMFDGQALTAPEGEPFDRRGILSLAGVYVIDVTPFPSNMPDGPAIANLRAWAGAQEAAVPEAGGSVRFLPMSKQVLPQQSTWLMTEGAFGTSRANPVILEIKGLAEIQGRFHFHLGGFWLESLAGNGAVSVNGFKLQPGYIAPLVTGQQVRLGEGVYRVTVQE